MPSSGPTAPPMPALLKSDVEPAELADRARDQRLDVGLLAETSVRWKTQRWPGLRWPRAAASSPPFDVEVGQHDVGALAGEQDRRRLAHAAGGAGDDRDLAAELSHLEFLPD